MRSRKDNGKRRSNCPPPKTNGHDLRRAIEWIVSDGIFAAVRLHGNVKWKPFGLVCLAIFWVWSSQPGLVEAAKDAIGMVAKLFGNDAVAVSSYQALTAALVRYTPATASGVVGAFAEFDATDRPSRLARREMAGVGVRRFPSERAADPTK